MILEDINFTHKEDHHTSMPEPDYCEPEEHQEFSSS